VTGNKDPGIFVGEFPSYAINIKLALCLSVAVSNRSKADAASEVQISQAVTSTNPGFLFRVKDIPPALKSLLCNATFMSLNMAGACESVCRKSLQLLRSV